MPTPTIREIISDAIAYWEHKRWWYNIFLLAVIGGGFALAWKGSAGVDWLGLVVEIVLELIWVNALFCLAYIPDIFAQFSDKREKWQRRRWILFFVGLFLAAIFVWDLAVTLTEPILPLENVPPTPAEP